MLPLGRPQYSISGELSESDLESKPAHWKVIIGMTGSDSDKKDLFDLLYVHSQNAKDKMSLTPTQKVTVASSLDAQGFALEGLNALGGALAEASIRVNQTRPTSGPP